MAMALLTVLVVVLVAMALLTVLVVVLMSLVLLFERLYSLLKCIALLYCSEDILTAKALPRGSYYNGIGVLLSEKSHAVKNFMLGSRACM